MNHHLQSTAKVAFALATLLALAVNPSHAQPLPTPYSWGTNTVGQLGDGTTTRRTSLVQVDTAGALNGKRVTQVDATLANACAVADGRVYCWGDNTYGQLGTGTQTPANAPVPVSTAGVLNGRAVTKVSVGRNHACAVADERVFCWGDNLAGQLGDGTDLNIRLLPVAMAPSALDNARITDVSAGESFTCVLADGIPYCWGSNVFGQLGDNTVVSRVAPQPVVTQGALQSKTIRSLHAGSATVCAHANDGVYCWGRNHVGQVGDGTFTTPRKVPTKTAAVPGTVSRVSLEHQSACAVADGKVYCWGDNSLGQLGDGTITNRNVPTATIGAIAGRAVTDVTAGSSGSCAVADLQAFCWGNNLNGILGTDLPQSPLKSSAAVQSSGLPTGKPLRRVAMGNDFTIALSATAPAAPRSLVLQPNGTTVDVSWEPPIDDGGSPISTYTASIPDGQSCSTTTTTCTLTGLRPGQVATVAVTATNAVGLSPTATGDVRVAKREQKALTAKGRPPKRLKANGVTVLTGRNARTNAGKLIKTTVTVKGSKRAKVLKQAKGKVSIRTAGLKGLRVIVRQTAAATSEYRAMEVQTLYVNGRRR